MSIDAHFKGGIPSYGSKPLFDGFLPQLQLVRMFHPPTLSTTLTTLPNLVNVTIE